MINKKMDILVEKIIKTALTSTKSSSIIHVYEPDVPDCMKEHCKNLETQNINQKEE